MARFRYQATDAQGNPVSGDMEAADAYQLRAYLQAAGLRLQSAEPWEPAARMPGEAETEGKEARAAWWREDLSSDERHQLAQQLADLTRAELPLASGLEAFAQELPRGRLRRVLQQLVSDLQRGDDLERVLASRHVPTDLLALLRGLAHRQGGPSSGTVRGAHAAIHRN